MRGLLVLLALLSFDPDEYDDLLARLRHEDPAAYEKVVTLDRGTGLAFLRERFSGRPSTKDAPIAEKGGPEVARERYATRAKLRVGEVEIEVADEGFGGIGIGGVEVRSRAGLRRFGEVRYRSHDGGIISWVGAETLVEPVDETFGGARFNGFRETWTFRRDEPFDRVGLLGTVELGGTTDGLLVDDGYRGWARPPGLRRVGPEAWTTPEKLRTGKHNGSGFAFQASGDGALIQFAGLRSAEGKFVGDILRLEKAPGDARLEHNWEFAFEPARAISLPAFWTLRVTGPEEPESLWAVAFDYVHSKLREELGLPLLDPTTACAWPPFRPEEGFREVVRRCLETTVREGFRCVLLDSIWRRAEGPSKHLVTADLEVAEEYGGVEGLRALVEACHERGLEVVAWAPAGHLQGGERLGDAPIFRGNPSWKLRRPDGRDLVLMQDLQWGDLTGAFGAYLEERLTAALRQTGLDGFWLDSYEATAGMESGEEGTRRPFAGPLLRTIARLYAAGAKRVLTEGASALSTYSTWTFHPPVEDAGPFYRSMLAGDYADAEAYVDRYFDACAANAPWIVPYEILYGPKSTVAASGGLDRARLKIREVNALFEAHRDRMRFRRTVPLGYEYLDDRARPRLLWVLRPGRLSDGRSVKAGDVVSLD